jgi:DNA-nicking Smr family endonuclease
LPARRRGAEDAAADAKAWADYLRHVRPLPGRHAPAGPPPADPPPEAPVAAPPRGRAPLMRPGPARALAPLAIGAAPPGLDGATWQRLRGGKLAPSRTLDLHGRTAARAHHDLTEFLHRAQADRLRCVEVITGRGTGEAGGVIRRELPLWLNLPPLRGLVLAAAHPHAANPGSVRLLLRKPAR